MTLSPAACDKIGRVQVFLPIEALRVVRTGDFVRISARPADDIIDDLLAIFALVVVFSNLPARVAQ